MRNFTVNCQMANCGSDTDRRGEKKRKTKRKKTQKAKEMLQILALVTN